MIVIAIVALVVLGPEKLPKIARTVGKFYGSMQRYMSGFKADIEREVALDNMRKATAEAQQKLLELQSQVQVLSGEIPELAGRASGVVLFDTPQVAREEDASVQDAVNLQDDMMQTGLQENPADSSVKDTVEIAAPGHVAINHAEVADATEQAHEIQSGKEGEVLWKKKA